MDLPLIAAVDLPLDAPGAYTMRIAIDGESHGDVRLFVRSESTMVPASGMVS